MIDREPQILGTNL